MDPRLAQYLQSLRADPSALDGWTITTAQRAGEDVGFVITKGPEIHILPTAEKKAMSRRNILEFVKPLLEQYGYVTTRVPIAETNHRLRVALGFEYTWSDAMFSYWALTKIPYERNVQ
jgi:hypothetical protein